MSTAKPEIPDRPPTPFGVGFSDDEGTLIATLQGDLDLASAAGMQAAVLQAIDEHAAEAVILDFTEVGFMDSTGLRAVLAISRRLELNPRAVVLLSPSRAVRKLLTLAGLDERVPVASSLQQAKSLLLAPDS